MTLQLHSELIHAPAYTTWLMLVLLDISYHKNFAFLSLILVIFMTQGLPWGKQLITKLIQTSHFVTLPFPSVEVWAHWGNDLKVKLWSCIHHFGEHVSSMELRHKQWKFLTSNIKQTAFIINLSLLLTPFGHYSHYILDQLWRKIILKAIKKILPWWY